MPRGAQTARAKNAAKKRDIQFKGNDQVYGTVTTMLGNGRLNAECSDGLTRMCRIRGSMRKREWVHVGDVVLVALRDTSDDKGDVLLRYTDQETAVLKRVGEYTPPSKDTMGNATEHDVEIVFEDDDDGVFKSI